MKKIILSLLLTIGFFFFSSPVYAASASLTLSPSSGSFAVGQEFEIKVLLNTGGGKTSGTDIYLNFSPNILQAQDIVPGSIYGQYIGKEIDNNAGRVAISGLAKSNQDLYQGEGTFATVKFKGKSAGTAQATFLFTPGSRNDSNVADFDAQSDILASTTGGSYQITQGVAGGPGEGTVPTAQPTPRLPITAITYPILLIATLGSLFLALGIYTTIKIAS